ncbi:probable ribosome-binding factor A, chloroplastic [Prosopis cineraria]|uniref:probable ribosome-binding factor A, chloroplastic n=1 Tax=Prosopis cineraria TaxID=364024 RepID=UPI00240EC55F|nr:probable ribosome-binding factor A, chloroplastic [Prosopis cineraria]
MPYLLHPSLATCPSRLRISSPLITTSISPFRAHSLVSLARWGDQVDKTIVGVTTTKIRCMANPRRVKMVAKQIRRELSDMLLTDKVLQYAVLPEASLGADRYLSSLTTISEVEVSADLQVVKVYVSVFGDERGKEVAIAGLKSKAKYVRSELGRRMKLRLTPEIRFIEDESMERGSRVLAILDKIKEEEKGAERKEQSDSSAVREEDSEWDDEDPDYGIIYVE